MGTDSASVFPSPLSPFGARHATQSCVDPGRGGAEGEEEEEEGGRGGWQAVGVREDVGPLLLLLLLLRRVQTC